MHLWETKDSPSIPLLHPIDQVGGYSLCRFNPIIGIGNGIIIITEQHTKRSSSVAAAGGFESDSSYSQSQGGGECGEIKPLKVDMPEATGLTTWSI